MAEKVTLVDEWLPDDFGSEDQPYKLIARGTLEEDAARFLIEFVVHDKRDTIVAEGRIKATVTNPLGFEILLPPMGILYGGCVATGLSHEIVSLAVDSDRNSKREKPELTASKRIADIFNRVVERRDEIKQAGKRSLITCLGVFTGGLGS